MRPPRPSLGSPFLFFFLLEPVFWALAEPDVFFQNILRNQYFTAKWFSEKLFSFVSRCPIGKHDPFFFLLDFFISFVLCIGFLNFSSWLVIGDIKKKKKTKRKRNTTHLHIHIYIFRIGIAKFSHSVIRTASIPVSRYYSSPSKLWKCWRKLYPWNVLGFSP